MENAGAAYERGTHSTAESEASFITGVRKDKARTESLAMTKLGMSGDVANLANMHAAYIQGSVPTAMEESRDIITDDFPDETNGKKTTDGFDRMPEAYERGSKNTFGDEASAIIPGAEKDQARTEALAAVNRLMAKRERELKGRKQMLGMSGDVANMANMHAAYIQGSVPTAKEESDDIITNDYPDETENAADSYEKQVSNKPEIQTLNLPPMAMGSGRATMPRPSESRASHPCPRESHGSQRDISDPPRSKSPTRREGKISL
jgi:hypothetical protein